MAMTISGVNGFDPFGGKSFRHTVGARFETLMPAPETRHTLSIRVEETIGKSLTHEDGEFVFDEVRFHQDTADFGVVPVIDIVWPLDADVESLSDGMICITIDHVFGQNIPHSNHE